MRQFNGAEIANMIADSVNSAIRQVVDDEAMGYIRGQQHSTQLVQQYMETILRLEEVILGYKELIEYHRHRASVAERKDINQVITEEPAIKRLKDIGDI